MIEEIQTIQKFNILPIHEELLDYMQIDEWKSFKGFLTSLKKDQFLELRKSFNEMGEEAIGCVLIRMFEGVPEIGDQFHIEDYVWYRMFCDMAVREIALYRMGYLELVDRNKDYWIFKATKKGEEYIEQLHS